MFAPLAIESEQPSREAWDRLVGMFAGAVGRGRIDKVVLARRVGAPVAGRARRRERPPPAGRERPGEHDLRVPARRADVPGLDAGAPRPNRWPIVPDDRGGRVDPAWRRRRRGCGPRPGAAGSEKDREEQAIVVDSIRAQLAPIAETLEVAPEPSVMTLRFVQHLATEISGTLPEARGLLSVAGLLHPTPAVGGEPRDVALALVDEHEGFDRGWYAGPDRLAGGGRRRRAVRRVALRDRRSDTGHAVRRLRHRRRLRRGRRVGGVAHQAPRGRHGAGHPGGRAVSDAALLRAFVAELVAAGVRDAVVCPGSRSTPLALALRANGDLRVRVLLDERAAGFFAVGMARTDRRPVVVLVTSGTAAMELGPAVVEAATRACR